MPEPEQSAADRSAAGPGRAGAARPSVCLSSPSDAVRGPWRGAVEWQVEPGWATPWRLPRGAVVREPLRRAAESATGVRAEFRTDATAITLPVRVTGTPRPMIDVLADGELVHRRQLGEGLNEVATPLSGAPADVEVWLPQDGRVSVGDLTLTGAGIVDIGRPARRRWYAYGSSITHCLAAAGPSQTWPSMVARRNGWDLTCLGFNGQAMLDLPVARTIAAAAPELVSLCVGINIFNKGLATRTQLEAQLREFIEVITRGGVSRVAVMSPIISPSRETTPNDAGITLAELRGLIAGIVADLAGDVSYVHGPGVFGLADRGLLSDGLHPDAAGYRVMGERLTPILRRRWAT